jgi:CRP/FNR family transcriptional regulator, cyclic AMP receptor protein
VRLGRNQKVDLIRKAPLFAPLSRRELERVATIADEIDLQEGKEMTRQGAPGREFFVILEGTADVQRDGQTINTLASGDFFGEIALISEEPRTATVVATSPVRALVVTARSFRRLMDESPEIRGSVDAAMHERVAHDDEI